jgi:hypothetical protein
MPPPAAYPRPPDSPGPAIDAARATTAQPAGKARPTAPPAGKARPTAPPPPSRTRQADGKTRPAGRAAEASCDAQAPCDAQAAGTDGYPRNAMTAPYLAVRFPVSVGT